MEHLKIIKPWLQSWKMFLNYENVRWQEMCISSCSYSSCLYFIIGWSFYNVMLLRCQLEKYNPNCCFVSWLTPDLFPVRYFNLWWCRPRRDFQLVLPTRTIPPYKPGWQEHFCHVLRPTRIHRLRKSQRPIQQRLRNRHQLYKVT